MATAVVCSRYVLKLLHISSVLGSYPRISIQIALLWMRNLIYLWCLHCAKACGNTQTFALISVSRCGYWQSVADASSMQNFYIVPKRAWHFLGKILSVLFRFHLTHLLFILHMPLNFELIWQNCYSYLKDKSNHKIMKDFVIENELWSERLSV